MYFTTVGKDTAPVTDSPKQFKIAQIATGKLKHESEYCFMIPN